MRGSGRSVSPLNLVVVTTNNVDKAESEERIVNSLQQMDDPCSVESDFITHGDI
jgi:hypothetical protein